MDSLPHPSDQRNGINGVPQCQLQMRQMVSSPLVTWHNNTLEHRRQPSIQALELRRKTMRHK
jgi:hypothetical protein